MAESNPTEILLAHDRWASRQMLHACAALSEEQFHRRFEMGPGSLHDTMLHIISASRRWADSLANRELRPQLDPLERRTAKELLSLLDETTEDFARIVHAHANELHETVSREMGGKVHSFTRGALVAHVTTHGMHHRAQCLNMLRQLGVTPLPASSVIQWTWMGEGNG